MAYSLVHGESVKFTCGGKEIAGLREIPEFSKPAKEKVDITCLTDTEKQYLAGIGDSVSELTFKFLYDAAVYAELDAKQDTQEFELVLSDGSKFTFEGKMAMTYHGGGVNTASEMSIVVTVEGSPVFTAK